MTQPLDDDVEAIVLGPGSTIAVCHHDDGSVIVSIGTITYGKTITIGTSLRLSADHAAQLARALSPNAPSAH